jgi:hypothetical protein
MWRLPFSTALTPDPFRMLACQPSNDALFEDSGAEILFLVDYRRMTWHIPSQVENHSSSSFYFSLGDADSRRPEGHERHETYDLYVFVACF